MPDCFREHFLNRDEREEVEVYRSKTARFVIEADALTWDETSDDEINGEPTVSFNFSLTVYNLVDDKILFSASKLWNLGEKTEDGITLLGPNYTDDTTRPNSQFTCFGDFK